MSGDGVDVQAIVAKFPSFSRVDERHAPLRRGDYERELLRSPRPIVLRGVAKGWPAYHRWTFDFLAEAGRGSEVVVVRSIVETAETKRETTDLGSYVRRIQERTVTGGPDQTYASQCILFDSLPDLKADVPFRELFGPLTFTAPAAWIGPAGTVSGLHIDVLPNLNAHIRGRKSFIFFPADTLEAYRSPKFDFVSGLSHIDLREPDFDRFPRLRALRPLVAHLDEGDGIYIPPGWWHFVVSDLPSVSLSIFAGRPRHYLTRVVPMVPKLALHHLGLYQRNNCICHNPG